MGNAAYVIHVILWASGRGALTRHWPGCPLSSHLPLAGGGGGVRRPLSNSRTADRSGTSDAAFESSRWDGLKTFHKFSKWGHVSGQGQVKGSGIYWGFQVTNRTDPKIAVLGHKFFQILLNHKEKNCLSEFLILSSGQGQDQVKFRSRKVTILKTHIRSVADLLWDILHVEYDGDGILAISARFGESRYKVRSRSG